MRWFKKKSKLGKRYGHAKNKVPLEVLEKRAEYLNHLVKARGGEVRS